MDKSEIVERLKETYEVKLYTEEAPRKLGQPSEEMVHKAFKQICDMWNDGEKSRGFIKYLISNFLPISGESKVDSYSEDEIKLNKNRCCLLRIKLADTAKIAEYHTKDALATGKLTKEEWNELKRMRRETPVEIKNGTVGYQSKDKNKYLSGEGLVALQLFTTELTKAGDEEVLKIVNRKPKREYVPRSEGKRPKNQQKKSTFGLSSNIDDETYSKLAKLRGELEKKK